MGTANATAAAVRRRSRQLVRAYSRMLSERWADDAALAEVMPYLARCLRAAWPLSSGSILRSTLHRVLVQHVQLMRLPSDSSQRLEARDLLSDAVRDLEGISRK